MTNSTDIKKTIAERILGKDDNAALLRKLIRHFSLEKSLLNLTNYEEATFHPMISKMKFTLYPEIDRISMVRPQSYHFCTVLKLEGHFKVKYENIAVPLPKTPDPFLVKYSGIVIEDNDNYSFKNEMLELV